MYIKRKLPISMLFVFLLALLCANSVYATNDSKNTPLVNKTPEEVKNLILNDSNSIANCVLNGTNTTSAFIEEKHEVPSNVKLSEKVTVTTPQFLLLMSQTILYLDKLTSSDASKAKEAAANYDKFIEELKGVIKTNIKPAPDPLDAVAAGEIKKADYLDMAKRLSSFIKTNGRLPNHVNSPIGKLGCNFLVCEFSNILNSYKKDGKLPDSIKTYLDIFKFETPVIAGYLGAYNIQVTKVYVKATARCNCGTQSYYKYYTTAFVNYCPWCGKYGTLAFEQAGALDGNYEGMWYCTYCDADYCIACGKEHAIGTKKWLTPYVFPKGETNSTVNEKPTIVTMKYNYKIRDWYLHKP